MSGLFISYRRQDAAAAVGRLHDSLAKRYGSVNVFLDLVDLDPGMDWNMRLKEAVTSADVMLVVIGPQWLDATDTKGRRRIDDPDDFIRSEIAAALRLDKRVVPVLVGGASMPSPTELTDDLRALSHRQAVILRFEDWAYDVDRLVRVLDPWMRTVQPAPASPTRPRFSSRIAQAYNILRWKTADDGTVSESRPRAQEALKLPWDTPKPPTAQRFDVFISYADGDRNFADDVVRKLEQRGRGCWIAHRDIPAGVPSWAEPIVTAIARSRLVIVLLTARSIMSVEVLREVTLADNEKIPLLPVSLDYTAMSPGLRYFFVAGHRLDVANLNAADRLAKISTAVDHQLSGSA